MNLKLEDKDLYDYIILILMYLQLVILEFFGLGRILNKVILVAILFKIIFVERKIERKYLYVLVAIGMLFILSFLFSSPISIGVAKSNFLMYLYPMAYAYYIGHVCVNKPHIISKCFEKGVYVFNITILVNFVALYIQILFPYSINAVRTIAEVTYYKDLISGFFEYCSVHVLNLFFIFIILFNYEYSKKIKDQKERKKMYLYITFLLMNEVIISSLNDNKMFFPVFMIVIFVRIMFELNERKMLNTKTIFSTIGGMSLFIILAYIIIPPFRTFINESIFGLLQKVLVLKENTAGSAERVAIFFYALSQGSTWLFGKGLGTTKLYTEGYCGFPHFGQSDLGSALLLGGVGFTAAMVAYYCFIISDITSSNIKKEHPNTFCFIFLIFCFMLFIQCISRTNLVMLMMMILMTFKFVEGKGNKNENRDSYIYRW